MQRIKKGEGVLVPQITASRGIPPAEIARLNIYYVISSSSVHSGYGKHLHVQDRNQHKPVHPVRPWMKDSLCVCLCWNWSCLWKLGTDPSSCHSDISSIRLCSLGIDWFRDSVYRRRKEGADITRSHPSPPYVQITVRKHPGRGGDKHDWAVMTGFNYICM